MTTNGSTFFKGTERKINIIYEILVQSFFWISFITSFGFIIAELSFLITARHISLYSIIIDDFKPHDQICTDR